MTKERTLIIEKAIQEPGIKELDVDEMVNINGGGRLRNLWRSLPKWLRIYLVVRIFI